MTLSSTRVQIPTGPNTLAWPLILLATSLGLLLLAQLLFVGQFGLFEPARDFAGRLPAIVWRTLTTLGDGRALFAVLLLLAVRHRQLVWPVLLAAAIGWLLTRGLKLAFHVPRPGLFFPVDALLHASERSAHNSFPSTHTAMAFSFAGVCVALLPRAWALPMLFLASAIGFARVAIGAHWPADVIAGALVGSFSAWLGIALGRRWRWGEVASHQAMLIGAILLVVMTFPFVDRGFPETLWLRVGLVCIAIGAAIAQYGRRLMKRPGPAA